MGIEERQRKVTGSGGNHLNEMERKKIMRHIKRRGEIQKLAIYEKKIPCWRDREKCQLSEQQITLQTSLSSLRYEMDREYS